jgi:exopolysaccharide biosynthesis polyprenyl glycosylphosphotransferase
MSSVTRLDPWRRSAAGEAPPAAQGPVSDRITPSDEPALRPVGRRLKARRGWLVRRSLFAADVAGLTLAYLLATLMYGQAGAAGRLGSLRDLLVFVATLPCWVVLAKLHGLYDRDEERADHSTADDVVGVFHLVTIGAWLLVVGAFLTGLFKPEISKVIALWLLAIVIVTVTRTIAREACRRSAAFVQNTLIVGAGDVGQLIARKLIKHPEYGINVVGFVDDRPKARRADLPDSLIVLGGLEGLLETIDRLDVERVVVAFSNEPSSELIAAVRRLRTLDVQVDLVPRLFEVVGPRVAVHTVEGLSLIGLPPARLTRSSRVLKRMIDVMGATVGLVLAAPLFAYIALRIRLDSPGPVLFRQTRLGAGMKEFTALKFRTMKVDTDASVHREYIRRTMSSSAEAGANGIFKLDRGDAVTAFGRWLRMTSLDELPQLVNVLRGDMSLVGPRPCIPYETEHFQPHQLDRFLVPQGITGLWQVTARANSTFGEALDMDVAYARSWSLGLDLRLLLQTPLELVRQRSSTA